MISFGSWPLSFNPNSVLKKVVQMNENIEIFILSYFYRALYRLMLLCQIIKSIIPENSDYLNSLIIPTQKIVFVVLTFYFIAVKVTLFGEIDEKTGMIMNMTDLKKYMEKTIMEPMDHKNLDKDVSFFATRASTTENLAVFIWNQMKEVMENPEILYEIEIYETENNIVKYRGE